MRAYTEPAIPKMSPKEDVEKAQLAKALSTSESPTSDKEPVSESEDKPIAPDQFDPRYETSRLEIYAYYS